MVVGEVARFRVSANKARMDDVAFVHVGILGAEGTAKGRVEEGRRMAVHLAEGKCAQTYAPKASGERIADGLVNICTKIYI